MHNDIDEVHHMWLGHEGCHPIATELLGIHHPVGTST